MSIYKESGYCQLPLTELPTKQLEIVIVPGSALQWDQTNHQLVLADIVEGEGAAGALIRVDGIAQYAQQPTDHQRIYFVTGGLQRSPEGHYSSRAVEIAHALMNKGIAQEQIYLVPPWKEANGNTHGNLKDVEFALHAYFLWMIDSIAQVTFISNVWQLERALLMMHHWKLFAYMGITPDMIKAVNADELVATQSLDQRARVMAFQLSNEMLFDRLPKEARGRLDIYAGRYKSGTGPGGVSTLGEVRAELERLGVPLSTLSILAFLNNEIDLYLSENNVQV